MRTAISLLAGWSLVALVAWVSGPLQDGGPGPLPDTFFGLDLQYGGATPWPNDVGLEQHQVVRLFLADGGLWGDVQAAGRGQALTWDSVDAYLQKARELEQPVNYVIAMTPTFAVAPQNRSTLCAWWWIYPGGCNPPDDWDDHAQGQCLPPADEYSGPNCTFKEYLVALVRRYRAAGTQDDCSAADPQCHGVISYYELWNEVDSYDWPHTRFWAGAASRRDTDTQASAYHIMARMVQDAAEVIHREDSAAQLIGPSFTGYDGGAEFEAFYADGGASLVDAVDIVSFPGYWEPEEEHSPAVTREMIQAYLDAMATVAAAFPSMAYKPLWDTEGGWGQSFHSPCQQGQGPCIHDPDRQEAYLARWYLHHWDLGVANATWFHWGNNGWGEIWCPQGNASPDHNVGCERLATDQPQLTGAGVAYQQLSRWLMGSSNNEHCEQQDNAWVCPITNPRALPGDGLIVWIESGAHANFGALDYATYWTLAGTEHAITGGVITIGAKPVLLY